MGGADIERIHFTNDDTIEFWAYPSSTAAQINVSAKLRDPSAWAHYMMSVDTTQSTASNRIKFFINGVHQTALDNSTYPSQNYEFYINSNKTHYIGEEAVRHRYPYSGLLADFYFIDGTALSTPVGDLIEDTGYSSYKPLEFDMSSYSGNSFHLEFEDSSDIGSDSTSNSNDWSTTGISSHDVMLDTLLGITQCLTPFKSWHERQRPNRRKLITHWWKPSQQSIFFNDFRQQRKVLRRVLS